MNPLLFPPRLIFRALDDLHSLAHSATVIAGVVESADIDAGLEDLSTLAEAARRLPEIEAALADVEQQVLGRVTSLEGRLTDVMELASRIEGGLPAIAEVFDRLDALENQLGNALSIVGRLESDISSLGQIAPSIDILTEAAGRLADTAGPLQGAAERLGRISDLLPGAARGAKVSRTP